MTDKVISFDRRTARHEDLLELRKEGYRVICPLCKSDIFFSENAGSWCSKNPNHYETHIYKASVRNAMRKRRIESGIEQTRENLTKKGYTEEQIKHRISQKYFTQPHGSWETIDDGRINIFTLDALSEELDTQIQFAIANQERQGWKHTETTKPEDNANAYDCRKRVYVKFTKD